MARNAKQMAETLAAYVNTSKRHTADVREGDLGFGVIYHVHVKGENWFDSGGSFSFFQRKPGTPGPQARFLGGDAQGYGKRQGKHGYIKVNTYAELDMWIGVCVTPSVPGFTPFHF